MLDIKLIREDAKSVEKKLKSKDPSVEIGPIVELDEAIRKIKYRVEELKSERNQASQKIGEMKRNKEDASEMMEQVKSHGETIKELDNELFEKETTFNDLMSRLPNIPSDEIKVSGDPKDNVIIKEVGKKPTFSFDFKNHLELSDKHNLFDFKRGAKVSGSGWPIYRGKGARLEWALLNYMIDTHIKNGFEQVIAPICVKRETSYWSGQLPKFEDQQFKITDEDYDLFLIPTAEVSLNGFHGDEILTDEELPIKYIAYTPCFRREAGAAGKGERGLIRTHQFNKVEMFCFAKPENSDKVFDDMMKSAEEILAGLGLHYRNALLVTGDMSFGSKKTIDIEVWLPGQDRYYEVSSVSNCGDFQARRSNCRYRDQDGKPAFLHTLNGSGLATSRLMVALLETNQQPDGTILIPEVLHPYTGFDRI
ncbi:MAG: serine--tRNA ligase [Chlamydiia bacterium]|nr:serine--tRNA ligase [Chlamydiia bacterium]